MRVRIKPASTCLESIEAVVARMISDDVRARRECGQDLIRPDPPQTQVIKPVLLACILAIHWGWTIMINALDEPFTRGVD